MLVYFIPCIILTFIFLVLYYITKDEKQEYPEDFVGSKGVAIISLNSNEFGLVYAKGFKEYKILKALSYKGEIKKGQTILIVKYIDTKEFYMVEPYV